MFSPVDPHLLYYAANVLFATKDGGRTWQTISPDLTRKDPGVPSSVGDQAGLNPKGAKQRGAIYSLAPAFHDGNTLWAGSDDGMLWITRDAGRNWKDITPPDLTAWSKVTQIAASHFDDESAYVSVSRFRMDNLRPYIYRTHDAGKTWKAITSGLPDNSPVDTVREDSARKGLLFAGTETAVWVSFDDGDHWQSLQLNLPHTSMRDLWIQGDDLVLATHGRSFWILDDITPLRQMSAAVEKSAAHVFEPALAFRVRRATNTDTPLPADEPAGENPPDGAIIDYFLAKPSSGPVALEILDAQGKLVRRFSSTDRPERSAAELQKEMIPPYWLRPWRALPTTAGMHRWVWDLRYPTLVSTEHEYPIAAVPRNTPRYPLGPTAMPGRYTVQLTVGVTYKTALLVKMDPRVKTSMLGLQKKFDLEMQLADAMTRGSQAVTEARSVQEQLTKIANSAPGALRNAAKSLNAKVSELLEGPRDKSDEEPALSETNNTVIALYRDIEKADVEPTPAQEKASTTTRGELAKELTAWSELKTKDIPSINGQLRSAGQAEIDLKKAPEQQEHGENEE
jgi:Sortilin, neurotensin receptor 3,